MATTKKTSDKATSGLGAESKEKKTASKKTTTKKVVAKKEEKPVVKKETKKTTTKKVEDKKTTKTIAKKAVSSTKKESSAKKEKSIDKPISETKEKLDVVKTKNHKTGSLSNAPLKHENKHYSPNRHKKRIKFCKLCAKGIEHVDYKDVDLLSKHLSYNLKILSKKSTNTCTSHQRRISNAIKRARLVALIPYIKD